jgi:hemerythrin
MKTLAANHLIWTDAMSVGIPALDSDHRCLVRIINLLHDVGPENAAQTIETVLETLILYSRYHFTREERIMEACSFPGTRFHRAEHAGFSRFIQSLRDRCHDGLNPSTAIELLDYLTEWLRHHILIQDMAYKPFAATAETTLGAMATPVLHVEGFSAEDEESEPSPRTRRS